MMRGTNANEAPTAVTVGTNVKHGAVVIGAGEAGEIVTEAKNKVSMRERSSGRRSACCESALSAS